MTAVLLKGEEVEVARAEVEAVRAAVGESDYASSSTSSSTTLDTGAAVEGRHSDELDRLLTLALQSGRVRALYGPGGEQAALRAYRKLPSGVGARRDDEAVNEALVSLQGRRDRPTLGDGGRPRRLHALRHDRRRPAARPVRLDRQGTRFASVEL